MSRLPQFRFYHLGARRLQEALPEVLETILAQKQRVLVQARSADEVASLDTLLWVYREDSFLPHGRDGDADFVRHPIVITQNEANPNRAQVRILLNPGDALRFVNSAYEVLIVLFDAYDEDIVLQAREVWKHLKDQGVNLVYQNEKV